MKVTIRSDDATINWNASGVDRIVQNVKNILRTRPFEVPFMPQMGVNHNFIDSTPQMIKSELATHVTQVINEFEPRASVIDITIESCDENGDYVIAVELEV